jgi:hypothetical protein
MNQRTGDDQFAKKTTKPEYTDEMANPEIKDDELDWISGGAGNSAWGTVQQGPGNGSTGP